LKGETGPQGPKGDTGAVGPQGPKGDPGVPGTARAYATVIAKADKAPYFAETKNLVSVIRHDTGVYFLFATGGITSTTVSPVVGTYLPKGETATAGFAYAAGPVGTTGFVVKTYTLDATGATVPADGISFTIMVP
jgi:hypothetical protein